MKPLAILFAAPPVASVTSVANYLSVELGLPVFSNDAIRVEVTIDNLKFNENDPEYTKRQKERIENILKSGCSFVYDASIDRTWDELKKP